MAHLSDQDIVAILKTGRPEDQVSDAWNCLIEKYQADLEAWAERFWNGDKSESEDSVQEAWINAFENIASFEEGNFRAWLYRILRNRCIDSYRKKKRRENRFKELPFGDSAEDNDSFDPVQQEADEVDPADSAEDEFFDSEDFSSEKYQDLLKKYLGRDWEFYLEYRENPNKSGEDRTTFHRVTRKLLRSAITDFVTSVGPLESIMTQREANALTQKYSLGRREADIFHVMGLTGKRELDELLFSGSRKLFEALLGRMPDDGN